MRRAVLVLGAFAVAATTAQSPARQLGADHMLARARATFRSHHRPAYVAYTLDRREWSNGLPDFENSYTIRVWYRASDGAALSRRMYRGRAFGELHFVRPIFNGPVDPGPPTADLFEPAPKRLVPNPADAAVPEASGPPTIGNLAIAGELEYEALSAGIGDGDALHLLLRARRDPERNRLRELWVDPVTYELKKLIAHDRLFILWSGREYPEIFEVTMGVLAGVPVVEHIRSRTVQSGNFGAITPDAESDYRFADVSFPATLPDWYFRPEMYGAHASEAPAR